MSVGPCRGTASRRDFPGLPWFDAVRLRINVTHRAAPVNWRVIIPALALFERDSTLAARPSSPGWRESAHCLHLSFITCRMNDSVTVLLGHAERHFRAGRMEEAEQVLQQIVRDAPDHGEALEGLAYIAANQKRYAAAADFFDRSFESRVPTTQRLHDAALTNREAGRPAHAMALLERELTLAPRHIETMHVVALAMIGLGQSDRAREIFERAIAQNPNMWELHYNLGHLLGEAGRYDEEIAAYERAIRLKPDSVDAHVNLGVALRDLHRFDAALKQFKRAVQLDGNHAGPRTNRAQTNLLLGEFEHGFREYEWRWQDGKQAHAFGDRMWRSTIPLDGKTLLIHGEQGFGDTIQFVRFIDQLVDLPAMRGAHIVLRVQDPLLPLLRDYPGAQVVIGEQEPVPPFDYHCPLLSLPFVLGTRENTIPTRIPYLQANPDLAQTWETLLANGDTPAAAPGVVPRVGVVWSGRPAHLNDRNRSMRFADWLPLFDEKASFVSLQKDMREDDRSHFMQSGLVRDTTGRLENFADTAALISQLDLVIAVDTAVAHLAGALGKPVWILLPFTPDWRWQLNRQDTPWYPLARLFRQPTRGDWAPVIRDVRAALQALRAPS
jgi:Tfp pilus assembly protein PilF